MGIPMWKEYACSNTPWPLIDDKKVKLTETALKRLSGNAMHLHVAGTLWAALLLAFQWAPDRSVPL